MDQRRAWDFRLALTLMWMIFTIALGVWLLIFHQRLFSAIEAIQVPAALEIVKHNRMVALEMGTMIVALLLGGVSLIFLTIKERQKTEQIRIFFGVFSHELKTSLSRLKLQSESLRDDLRNLPSASKGLRFLDDIARLELQLENSLWVARADEDRFLIEEITLSSVISEMSGSFPLQVHLSSDAVLKMDRRALESILKNLFQNSLTHGSAENIWIQAIAEGPNGLRLEIRDDGKGFQGRVEQLGNIFGKQSSTSGTGLGLYLIKKLTSLSEGSAQWISLTKGFQVNLILPGHLPSSTGKSR